MAGRLCGEERYETHSNGSGRRKRIHEREFCRAEARLIEELDPVRKAFLVTGCSLRGLKIVNGNLGNGEKPSGETERLISRRLFCRFCAFSGGWHHQEIG